MTDEIFLPWPEVAKAISHYIYAKYGWPDGAFFELTPKDDGLLIERLTKTDDETA